jgi:hypothetical protein
VNTPILPALGASRDVPIGYGTLKGAEDLQKGVVQKKQTAGDEDSEEEEGDPQDNDPGLYDFCVAVGFIVFGVVAMTAGLASIFAQST